MYTAYLVLCVMYYVVCAQCVTYATLSTNKLRHFFQQAPARKKLLSAPKILLP